MIRAVIEVTARIQIQKNNKFFMWGFTSTKMRTDDYEVMLDRGWQRSGTWYYRPDIKKSCCPLYTPRLDVTEFKLSKQQKKHMRRFNQYINGERDFKIDEANEIVIKDEKIIKQEKAEEEYASYLKKLDKERTELKELLLKTFLSEGLFINQLLSEEAKEEIKQQTTIENIDVDIPDNNLAHYSTNIVDLVIDKTEPIMPKEEYIRTFQLVVQTSKEILDKFKLFAGLGSEDKLMFSSKTYVSDKRAKKVLFEEDEEQMINKHNEIKYMESGNEQQIAIEASNSRSYTEFFEEMVPNKTEESKRPHKYSVSIHRAISYKENLEVFKKFDKARFGKERIASDFEGFLTNSSLYDPRDKNFENVRTYCDEKRIDGDRIFKDEGVWPEFHGTYHIHHRIDDKLVAINVWDITENTLGSIYTFYDPAYSFLSLGHVTAVREMEYMNKIRKQYNPNLKYYYMGYYVHNCQK